MDLDLPICLTCGVQYGAERADCPICLDERQYVGWDGQQWTTLARLTQDGHRGLVREEGPGVIGIGADPPTAIGQRALLVRAAGGNVLFDMITYIDDDLIAQVRELGGISAIAISHPHFYGSKCVACGQARRVPDLRRCPAGATAQQRRSATMAQTQACPRSPASEQP